MGDICTVQGYYTKIMVNETMDCMVCDNTIEAQLPHDKLSFVDKVWIVAREYNWVMGQGEFGIFICCPDCYPKAFDRSKGGSVGFLRS